MKISKKKIKKCVGGITLCIKKTIYLIINIDKIFQYNILVYNLFN